MTRIVICCNDNIVFNILPTIVFCMRLCFEHYLILFIAINPPWRRDCVALVPLFGRKNQHFSWESQSYKRVMQQFKHNGASAPPTQFPIQITTKTEKFTYPQKAHFLLNYTRFCFGGFFNLIFGNFVLSYQMFIVIKRREGSCNNFFLRMFLRRLCLVMRIDARREIF